MKWAFEHMDVKFTWWKQWCQVLRATSSSSLCYLKDLFSTVVSSTALYKIAICILMSLGKNSMQFNQLLVSWFRVKMHENVEVIPQFITVHPLMHSKIMWSREWVCMHSKNIVLFFNPKTRWRSTMVFGSWTSTVTYTFYGITLLYHLSLLNYWGF